MIDFLAMLLRIAGAGLLLLAAIHIPISRHLGWKDDCARLTPVNASIFRVHALFICLVLVLMGMPCVIEPEIFLHRSRAGLWISWSFAAFWGIRLYCQHFVYQAELWRGKLAETWMHHGFTLVWMLLTALFAMCGLVQSGVLGS